MTTTESAPARDEAQLRRLIAGETIEPLPHCAASQRERSFILMCVQVETKPRYRSHPPRERAAEHRHRARYRDGRVVVFAPRRRNHQRPVRHRLFHVVLVYAGSAYPQYHHRHAGDRAAGYGLDRARALFGAAFPALAGEGALGEWVQRFSRPCARIASGGWSTPSASSPSIMRSFLRRWWCVSATRPTSSRSTTSSMGIA